MRADIIVIDDEAGPRAALRIVLKQDHDVRTADSGPAGLAMVEEQKPDLVFLDLNMPGMDGTEVLQEIKSRHPDIQVAIITAYAAVESARLAVRFGAIDYLIKPYAVSDVLQIVDKALETRRQDHDDTVLAAQLARMSDNLVEYTEALAKDAPAGVADAVDSLRAFQSTIDEDLETVRQLYELGEVTAEFSHDLNNLLTIILTSSQFLHEQLSAQDQPDPRSIGRWVSTIATAAGDCTTMLEQIKSYVRMNVNQNPQPVCANDLVASVGQMVRDRVATQDRDVEVLVHQETVPRVPGDEVALRSVLVNLFENSLDAIQDEGCVELATETGGNWVCIHVRDNGCGMSAETLARVKQAFFSTKQSKGTGLGLSIADKVAKRHQGRLLIDSTQGEGTTVTLQLPIEPALAADQHEQPQPAPTARQRRYGTVLVVEDQPAMLELMAKMLQAEGYTVVGAHDGVEGWRLFRSMCDEPGDDPFVVVTDHEMPNMLGRELAAKVKQVDRSVPVILVTGYEVPGEGPEDAIVGKPFGVEEFVGGVNRQMDGIRHATQQHTAAVNG